MKKLFQITSAIFAIIFVAVSCAKEVDYSTTGGIYGVVANASTYQPIQGANVVISPTNISTTTGADGTFSFSDLAAAEYKLTITASGYTYNSRQVTVIAGQTVSADINLTAEEQTMGFSLSPESLVFGSSLTELTFTISNTGNSSSTSWSITGVDADWLTVSPTTGVTAIGESSAVKVSVNRSNITDDQMAYFIVNAGGGSKQILVTISPSSSSSSDSNSSSDESTSTTTTAVTNGLWAYYTFDDETMNDSWENGMNGLIENSATFLTNTPNGSGKALKLGLNSDNLLVKARVPYNPFANKTEYSYCFWVKEPSQGLIMNAYGNSTDSNTANYPVVRIYDSKLYACFNSYSMNDYFNYNTTTLQDGDWHHIAVSVANNSQILYVDGTRVSTQQESVGSSESSEIHFGGELYSYEGSDMKLDNIRIYSRTISASDALNIYNSEK